MEIGRAERMVCQMGRNQHVKTQLANLAKSGEGADRAGSDRRLRRMEAEVGGWLGLRVATESKSLSHFCILDMAWKGRRWKRKCFLGSG